MDFVDVRTQYNSVDDGTRKEKKNSVNLFCSFRINQFFYTPFAQRLKTIQTLCGTANIYVKYHNVSSSIVRINIFV